MLIDDEDASLVRDFRTALLTYVRENGIQKIAIKKRNKKGDYAGGPVSFKLEGLIQLIDICPITLLAPATIAAAIRKSKVELPEGLAAYQRTAFETAYASLDP